MILILTNMTNDLKIDMKYMTNVITNGDLLCYHGSLTTPPCSEGVKRFVLQEKPKYFIVTIVKI